VLVTPHVAKALAPLTVTVTVSERDRNIMNELAKIESTLVQGDISKLNPEERTKYYLKTCETLGLNPLTKPFDYITLNGKLTLYAKRDCTDQLRKLHNVSIEITSRTLTEDIYSVTARARIGDRTDESIGAVCLGAARGEAKANLLMKAETKAKRRVTLSICGLGLLDETEVETVHANETPRPVVQTAERTAPRLEAPKVVVQTETKVAEEKLEMPEMPVSTKYAPDPEGHHSLSYRRMQQESIDKGNAAPSDKQCWKIVNMLRELGFSDDLSQEWLVKNFSVTKTKELTKRQASQAIDLLTQMKDASTPPPTTGRSDDDFLREIEQL